MARKPIPVYMICGFLDAGKTNFIAPMLTSPEFTEDERTLLLICEEGEEEYDADKLGKFNVVPIYIEGKEEMTLERMNALEAALRDRIPLSMLTLMKLMVFRGHARELPRMMAAFRDQVREHRGESNAEVWSAVPLTDKEQQALRDKLEKRFGKKMILKCQVDPSLLGGVRVETEGRVLDGTLRTRLQEIKEVMDA